MNVPGKNPLAHALLLAGFALVGAGLLSLGNSLTRGEIEKRQGEDLDRSLKMVLPAALYDNEPGREIVHLAGKGGRKTLYMARKGGALAAVALEETVLGYGHIHLIMGIDMKGRVLGVRVLEHEETPGLGDQIDERKSDWILKFDGLSIGHPPLSQWRVKKDGGQFDQFSGATITPRAVVKAVREGLQFFNRNKARLLALPIKRRAEEEEGR